MIAIDDDGQVVNGLINSKRSWNYLSVPSSINIDKYLGKGWGIEGVMSYTQYKIGTLINDSTNYEGHFASLDLNAKYHFQFLYAPKAKWLDPFANFGLGYTYRSALANQHTPNISVGLGINFFFMKNVGIQLRSTGKIGVYPYFADLNSNYLQHSAGLIFRFQPPKHTNGDFGKRKNQWAFGNKRFKNKGGH